MGTEHFGQLVIGPPGSGKTTYCTGMYDLLTSLGRDVRIINLDPACSPHLPYPCAIDIRSLITLQDVMDCYGLGPNGGIIYAMEYLATNIDWLRQQMLSLPQSVYLMFDFPGQVELYTCSAALDTLFTHLQSASSHLTAVHLIDSYHLHSPSTFLSAVLLSLSSMCRLSLPHVNVLSKIDTCERMGQLPLPLSFYTDGMELAYLMQHIRGEIQHDTKRSKRRLEGERREEREESGQKGKEQTGREEAARIRQVVNGAADAESDEEEYVEFESGEMSEEEEEEGDSELLSGIEPRYLRLSELLCELVDSYSMVSFATLNIHDKRSVLTLLRTIDTSNGYIFTNTDKEYEMAMSRQHEQRAGNEQQQSASTATSGGYSMFNLVNTQQSSQPALLPPSVQTSQPHDTARWLHYPLTTDRPSLPLYVCALLCSLRLTIREHSETVSPG